MVTGEGVGERGIIAAETSTGEAHMEEKALQLLDNLFGTDLCLPFLSGVPWKWGVPTLPCHLLRLQASAEE